ncbi:LexA family transcriptional repressor [Aeromonas hydrophila]|uniref:LexA family protein n=1 Tax=Aeromonas hydrophila TaxID=644 RepID=UPI001116873C|nr:S24 family peptidase [Aeromonas hydrophila]TNH89124.1 LexA family transcriptional repressor [Aeromonas hydrophila]TNI00978.1 LexA family transcriptional repressor [Aeromonas hydrophila]TNI97970.1 LexA family transcriptional repressor [Aeromonas hydrophila]
MKINERIKQTRKRLGYSQEILGSRVGVSRVSISQWERGENTPNGRYLNDLAAALGVTVDWLLTGEGEGAVTSAPEVIPGYHNVEPAVIPQGNRIPILSYVQAGNWREICEQATTFDGNVEYVTAGVEIGPCGFGLWLRGNSMTPFFNEGDLVIIDPDEQPRPGDYVVAKNGSEEATFKKYRPRGIDESGQEVFELVPLNDDFPTMHSDRQHIEIIGVMVEHRIFRKR